MRERLDYSLVLGDRDRPSCVLVEDFALRDDFTATGIDTTSWTVERGGWASSAAFSRAVRVDPSLRARVRPVPRAEAEAAFLALAGGDLPDEATLRAGFHEREPIPGAAPLRLGPADAGRIYRILFANQLDDRGVEALRAAWGLEPSGDAGVVGTARLAVADHAVEWVLRRIGAGIAWSVDATVRLGAAPTGAIGTLLHDLRQGVRHQGLIPVTIERFA